jgi:hypothetical protein
VDAEKLQRDIDTLKESIRLSWVDLDRLQLTLDQRLQIRGGISQLIEELKSLVERMDKIKNHHRT